MLPSPNIPSTMRAVQGKGYGDIDAMLSVQDHVKVPRLSDAPEKKRKNSMIIKVLAVALAPGDCRVLSGKTREFQGPPSMPYVPGGDCCGIVVELPENTDDLPFKVGDRVAVRFDEKPAGALGEYALVSTRIAAKVPDALSSDEAAALASASPAVELAEKIQKGERVLVMGAGGGIGSHFCQVLRERGASFIAGVSKSPDRLLKAPLLCDKAFDYTCEDPFSSEELKNNPFDVIVDLASGGWPRLLEDERQRIPSIVKPATLGGRYITTTPDSPIFEAHSLWELLQVFLFPALWRALYSRTWSRARLPGYTFGTALSSQRTFVTKSMDLFSSQKLKPVMEGPFPFTTEGVRSAFRLQESRHAHGKVVIHVADK